MPKVVDVRPMEERLRDAAQEVREDALALKLSRQRRDSLVRQAIEREGMSYRAVGAAAGLGSPRIAAILGTVDDDDDQVDQ
jgi:hypothetical protein